MIIQLLALVRLMHPLHVLFELTNLVFHSQHLPPPRQEKLCHSFSGFSELHLLNRRLNVSFVQSFIIDQIDPFEHGFVFTILTKRKTSRF